MISAHKPRQSSPLDTYFREIDETPLLQPDEEKELAYRIEEGDSEARDHLVRANLRLVVSLARASQGKGLDLHDLIAEGNLGLMRAAEAFDPSMNTRFSTYASYWIKQSIRRALVNTAKTIRLPCYMVQLLSEWRRETARLEGELGRVPTEEEVARSLKLPKKKLAIIKKAIRVYNSMPQTDETDSGCSLDNMLIAGKTRAPGADMADADEMHRVLGMLDQLEPREAAVLRLRFGLDDEQPHTLQEIGERLGLTRERVRQIEREGLDKLSEKLLDE
jgi:RNA polymerase primary sigma factor